MEGEKAVILILYVIAGALLAAMSIPLIRGRVGPNRWYGFRTGATLKDPTIWYPANAYAGWRALGLGVALVLAATVLYFVEGLPFLLYAFGCAAILLGGLALILVQSHRYMRKLVSRDIGRQG